MPGWSAVGAGERASRECPRGGSAAACERDDVVAHGLSILEDLLLGPHQRRPRDLVDAGDRLRPRGGGQPLLSGQPDAPKHLAPHRTPHPPCLPGPAFDPIARLPRTPYFWLAVGLVAGA